MKRLVTLAIIVGSALLGVLAAWRAPGVDRYSRDWLTRARGVLPAPDDIAIVAIDDASIVKYGRFPWPRSVMARAIDTVADARPKAIALDVLYTDATTPAEDLALSEAVRRAGNVVVAAQLTDSPGGPVWLGPLPPLRAAAAATGHVNVHIESEGVAREVPVGISDDAGNVLRAMPIEAIRVGENLPETSVVDQRGSLLLGRRVIPVNVDAPRAVIEAKGPQPVVLRGSRIPVEYIGPAGSFTTYSLADIAEGAVPASRLRDRYVLIGATATSLGDRIAAPFTHYEADGTRQHGSPMPGVEVLANALNTLLRERFPSEVGDAVAFLWAAGVAAFTLGVLTAAQGGRELLKQTAALAFAAAVMVLISWVTFRYTLIYPPVTAQVVSFASAGMIGLLRRSAATRGELDAAIQSIQGSGTLLVPPAEPSAPAEAIGRLLGARGVLIERRDGRRLSQAATWGEPVHEPSRVFEIPGGRLVLSGGSEPDSVVLRAVLSIAESALHEPSELPTAWPDGAEARARVLRRLNADLIDRARFVSQAMRSVEDGLAIAGPDARIVFVNPSAAATLQLTTDIAVGQPLFGRLAALDNRIEDAELLRALLVDRTPVEREVSVRSPRPRRLVLRAAPVLSTTGSAVIGIVASLSDITRQAELQQTKNDVISLVSHEMRTPLTAIQGLSELLAAYDIPGERRREMTLAINDEVKRLTRMITQYLDIARLESGATVLRLAPVRIEPLIERLMLMAATAAEGKGIRLRREVAQALPGIAVDGDLLFRALENLVSNAVKYSPPGTEVTISARATESEMLIEVADEGPGIPAVDAERIFEKFYRVPRVEDADVPGTGLGLSLVREIVELHGGSVHVQGNSPSGSVFVVRLALHRAENVKLC
jgi:signal transduction histidine kinase/CHASE2 domain-containing sensor protein